MLMPTIDRYVTRQPWTIRRDAKLSQAREMMREHHIRHLPVLEGGKLVGIVSERDILLLERLLGDGEVSVEEAMNDEVYAVPLTTPLDAVVDAMAVHKYGSVVVTDPRGTVAGIFTTVDGMDVLAETLRRATA